MFLVLLMHLKILLLKCMILMVSWRIASSTASLYRAVQLIVFNGSIGVRFANITDIKKSGVLDTYKHVFDIIGYPINIAFKLKSAGFK